MLLFRAVGLLLIIAMMLSAAAYLFSGRESYLKLTWKLARVLGGFALVFFGVLLLERLAVL